MNKAILLLCIAAIAFAAPGPITWKVCSGSNAHGSLDSVEINPNPVVPFVNTTAHGFGLIDKRVTQGSTWKLSGSYRNIPVLKKTGDLCSDSVIDLPFKSGAIYIQGLSCPQEAGKLDVIEKALFNVNPPSGTYKIDVTMLDQDQEEILCLEISVPM
ncbi:hypothetical protein WA158_004107 [Blastocystis sp. Blastoise]